MYLLCLIFADTVFFLLCMAELLLFRVNIKYSPFKVWDATFWKPFHNWLPNDHFMTLAIRLVVFRGQAQKINLRITYSMLYIIYRWHHCKKSSVTIVFVSSICGQSSNPLFHSYDWGCILPIYILSLFIIEVSCVGLCIMSMYLMWTAWIVLS